MDQRALAEAAIEILLPSIEKLLASRAKRQHMHIVVMNPAIKPWEGNLSEAVLYEYSIGQVEAWEHDYRTFALKKAEQAWRDGKTNMEKHLLAPATLHNGDVAYYGSFDYHGVIVGASGIEAWFDVLVSGWVAITIQQLAQEWYHKFKSQKPAAPYIE